VDRFSVVVPDQKARQMRHPALSSRARGRARSSRRNVSTGGNSPTGIARHPGQDTPSRPSPNKCHKLGPYFGQLRRAHPARTGSLACPPILALYLIHKNHAWRHAHQSHFKRVALDPRCGRAADHHAIEHRNICRRGALVGVPAQWVASTPPVKGERQPPRTQKF
jgi:hypothetical protein